MLLSDVHIKQALDNGQLIIKPLDSYEQLQPCSVDLRLGDLFVFPDVAIDHVYDFTELFPDTPTLRLPSHTRIHAQTVEYLELPDYLCGSLSTRSSIDRLGVVTNGGSTLVHPGFKGTLLLELYNYGAHDVFVPLYSRICTIAFHVLSSPAQQIYAGQFQSQTLTRKSDSLSVDLSSLL